MKSKLKLRILVLAITLIALAQPVFGDLTDSIRLTPEHLRFSSKEGYDVIGLKDQIFLEHVGEPMLPTVNMIYVVPYDVDVKEVGEEPIC